MSEPKFPPDLIAEQSVGEIWAIRSSDSRVWTGFSKEEARAMSTLAKLYAALDELVSTIIIDDEEGLATFLDPIQRAQAALAMARGEQG